MKEHAVQNAALEAGQWKHGFAYYMEQGLGKTYTTYKNFERLVEAGGCTRMVVSCPNSFKGGWVDEAEKWGFNEKFDIHIYNSDNEFSNDLWLRKTYKKPPVLIINHEAIRKSGTKKEGFKYSKGLEYIESFISGKKVMVVEDESIKMKDPSSQHTRGMLHLADNALDPDDYRRLLSGKPTSQGPHDLWAQMRFIGNLKGFEYQPFKAAFCRMGGAVMKKVVGAQNEEILAERIDPWVFRATKAEWTDLPPKLYTIREYTLSKELRAMYKSMENDFVVWLENDKKVTIEAAITKYIKLAQIQAGFIYDENGKTEWLVKDESNARLNALIDFVENELVGKAIIIYNHKPVRDQLERALGGPGVCAHIHGGMATAEVEDNKRRFNTDRSCRYILITKSAKYGHTLLGNQDRPEDACSTELFYENTYSLDDRSQLEDRDHRHGQKQETNWYVDFAGTPLDRNCVKALQMKEEIFQAVFQHIGKKR